MAGEGPPRTLRPQKALAADPQLLTARLKELATLVAAADRADALVAQLVLIYTGVLGHSKRPFPGAPVFESRAEMPPSLIRRTSSR